jgi:hypothetical protein
VSGCGRKLAYERYHNIGLEIKLCEYLECFGKEGIADKEGGSLSENQVDGGLAASFCVIIHTWKIVVDEGVGMNELQGSCGCNVIRVQLGSESFYRCET